MAKTPHEELAARIAELESSGRVSHGLTDDRDSAAVPRRGAELAARGAEASGTSEARSQAELDALRDARAGRPVTPDSSGSPDLGGTGDPDEFGTRALAGPAGPLAGAHTDRFRTSNPTDPDAPQLPSRDVNDVRGPSLVSLEGQLAHDEALGVGPDGREIAPPKPKRQKKAKPAELAFTEVLPHQQATDLAYKLVSRREHTAKQVRDKLTKKDCEPASIEAAIAELQRHNFVDDRRYAKLFAEDKRRLQGWGARRIRMALTQAGISRDLLDELFADDEEALDAPSEMEVALDVLRRKQPDLSDVKVKTRMVNLLARRGIASSTVFAAIRQHQKSEAE